MLQNNNEIMIPEWMKKENNISTQKDHNGFLSKSLLSFFNLFRHFHVVKNENISQLRAGTRFLLVFTLILFSSLSKNLLFCSSILAGLLIYLCFANTKIIKKVLITSSISCLFTALIMMPAYFIYKSHSIFIISYKVYISTGILSLFVLITPWNKITSALSFIKIPNILIFILDLTIHYILILGNIAYDMLEALKLRSIGKNKTKEKSFGGILGTVFLKSIAYSKETQQAMECRLFNGVYNTKKYSPKIIDFFPIFVLFFYIVLFFIFL